MNKLLVSVSAAALLGFANNSAGADQFFNRIASIPVSANLGDGEDAATTTSAEIITATEDGMMIVYSDSPRGVVGMIDIADPRSPAAAGIIRMEGEPTAVHVAGNKVLAGVNTSGSFTEPSGHLAVIDLASKTIESTCDLGGQPDSLAVSPDGSIVAIAIENERDEEVDDGRIPQLPAGNVVIFRLTQGVPDCGSRMVVDLTGIAEIAPEDPEPEFVDINAGNEIVVSLQENNHIAVIDGTTGAVKKHFSAGAVDLENIDAKDDGALRFEDSLAGVRREPDAVRWLDESRFVAANEGDYEGGSRGFTIFNEDGTVAYESGAAFEHAVAAIGHYPEGRSDAKGIEPEGLEVASFDGVPHIFVMSERGSVIGVYRDTGGEPELVQLLPSGIGPESAVAIPGRNLLVSANETDLGEDGLARAHVMVFERAEGSPAYPQLRSVADDAGVPLGWGAMSGLFADPAKAGTLYAVNDSVYGMRPTIFTIDATQSPAAIIAATPVTRHGQPAQKLDIEGIAGDGDGGFWLASEGRTEWLVPHALYRVNSGGEIEEEVSFPPELLANEIRYGAEGVAIVGEGDDATLWVAVQREWKDDAKGVVKLVSYTPASGQWGAVNYPLDAVENGWIGLSEITAYGDHLYIVERDNLIGEAARVKKLFRVAIADLRPGTLGGELPTVKKEEVRDLIPDLKSMNGYVVDKVEGFAIDASGIGYVLTDNDGVDDSSGETLFFPVTIGSSPTN